jgi:hypothetical protein
MQKVQRKTQFTLKHERSVPEMRPEQSIRKLADEEATEFMRNRRKGSNATPFKSTSTIMNKLSNSP